jgi:Ca2+-binding RTX toxin-like protein
MAISSTFDPNTGVLSTTGDDVDNTITTSRNAAGTILVNGGAVPIVGGAATVANTGLITAFGQGGNDTIALDEANGVLPSASLSGGDGNDTITGGSGADQLFGQAGNDVLLGKGGNDFLFGGAGDDVLTGGAGDDQVFGEAGNDRMIWNPGDGTDLFEGGDGTDTAEVNGGNGAEVFTVTANGARVRFDRLDPAPFTIDIGATEKLVVNANGGDDVITAGNGLAGLVQLTIDGGAGNDTITGGDGNDVLLGGDGNDVITGGRGNDMALLGAGDDTFVWNPGDGSDTVEGQDGVDTLVFNGANVNENIDISANGGRVRFFRDVANVTMDLNGVERIAFNALGGADTVTVNDLSGTGTTEVDVNLAAAGGGGDGSADTVVVNATNGADNVQVLGSGTSVAVLGLPTLVNVSGSEGANDSLVVNGGAGDDTISAATLPAGTTKLTIDGGAGNDSLIGSQGADLLLGGDGDDTVTGGVGNDVAFLGAGNDVFVWNPGDGSDTVEGQAGVDALLFNGANANENIHIFANGGRVDFVRDVANITMDLNGVEGVIFRALGGVDNITIDDVSGTDLALSGVAIDLGGAGGGDGSPDTVTVNGRAGNDNINVSDVNGTVLVTGSPATVAIFNAEATDQLVINGGAGDDVMIASGLTAGAIGLTIDGGAGNDVIVGGQGADKLLGGDGDDAVAGGRGDDVAFLGAGNDVFGWNPGDGSDIVEGQAGLDGLIFNGANANENIDISANGNRVRFFRDVANITMDLNGVEGIRFEALGGADNIAIHDLSGTDVPGAGVVVDLEGALGSGVADGQLDTVTIDGRSGDDAITVTSANGGVAIAGASAPVFIFHADATDQLILNGGAGNDVIDASHLPAGQISLTLNGGAGNDTLIGSQGNDTFVWNPGDGSDTVEGQAGVDALLFNGANASENIDISANGSRVRFTRDIANITMDLNGVEGVIFRALGGADNITIDDVSGTDLALSGVAIDLGGAAGGGDGAADTVTVNGRAGNDNINISTVNGVVFTTGSPATVAIFNAEAANDRLIVNSGSGDDTINASGLAAGAIGLTIDGGTGNDTIIGSQGDDILLGGDGNDTVTGGRGNDVALLGAGNDVFVWNPGDGSDTVEGQAGLDGLIFNGANANENIDISANGSRVLFHRDVASITMDLNGVEGIRFEALGGADNIAIHDLSGTDVPGAGVVVDLEGALGSGMADGQVDTVTVDGTAGNDAMTVTSANGGVAIAGASAPMFIFHADATDQLVINGGAGNDVIDASHLPAGQISLTLNGGAGDDTLIGSQGNDLVNGGTGNDVALLGAGNDTFVWNPGDGSDTVEGQAGVDALLFNGANANENIHIFANGGRVDFVRDVANITMDLNGVEGIVFRALGGVDNITIDDVSGTDLARSGVAIDLGGAAGGGDGAADTVTVNGRAGNDNINVGDVNGTVLVTGSPATVAIVNAEATDQLVVNGGAGDDTIDASGLTAGAIGLTIDGGAGNDTLIGGAGNDTLIGGAGLDHLSGGAGQDTFVFTGASLAALDTGMGANRDVIQNFSGDIIDLHQIDANVNAAGDQAFSFIGTNAFSAAGQVRFVADGAGNTIVEGNVDNDLHADFQIELHAFTAQLQAGHFVL